ncbi:dTDP-glucose 4,6-dehydratase [Candidatus Woesearchaeota archaeon]|nr:dTDP-glucose 4,6-dehydratase [Candidatus Woesearchaeota archaeon]|tara:strand:+ start:4251 stop:5204 length:954 start_codon:yes stop_codon:yes gene_type:complete
MKLLITGGCGFIGSNFVRLILNKYPDYKIINLDKLTYAGNLENLKEFEDNKNYTFVKGDISDNEIVAKVIEDVDVIINFAAESHVDRSISYDDPFLKTNIIGTHVLLKAALKHQKRLLQISTDEVYGSIEKESFTEDSNLNPSSPYSASKASADLLCMSYFLTHELPVTIVRSTNNFGPYQYPEKIIPLFISNLMDDKKAPLYGDGKNVRDWLFVEDCCEAINLVLHKSKPGEIYNIGSGKELPNIELARLIIEILDKGESLIDYVADRKGHDRRYSLDTKKIRALGWSPKRKFEEALKNTISWYTDNRAWWEKLKN